MQVPLQITARGVHLSGALRARIEEKAAKLEQFFERIIGCRVTLAVDHRRHTDRQYTVRIDVTVPGKELVVTRESGPDMLIALRDAFDAAERRLEDYVHLLRGEVKHHEGVPMARISQIFPESGYGYLQTAEGARSTFTETACATTVSTG
jgi:ribosomal subunit interface protein